jgi:DNA-binding response OmpR family regulator
LPLLQDEVTVAIDVTILVVDDEPRLREGIRLTLEAAGYQVLTAADGIEALAVLGSQPVDLILADIAMPRMNGYQMYERVRENPEWTAIPFVFLTARAMDSDVRYGKELGADDYLTKPIEADDMLAVIRGKLRRAQQMSQLAARLKASLGSEAGILIIGDLHIDPGQHRVWMGGEPIKLSAREFTLLEYLAWRANQVVSPQELVQTTHGLETDRVEAGALLRPLIRSLRRKLGYPVGDMGCIENVRGVGYRLSLRDD